MKPSRIISIDPGHGAYSICTGDDWYPCNVHFTMGKEKPNTLGCPELVKSLLPLIKSDSVVVIEEPYGMLYAVKSLTCDIGYIAGVLRQFEGVALKQCRHSDWKKCLESYGYLPPKSGNITGDKYKPILDAKFEMNLTEDNWSSWGIFFWAVHNID